MTELKEPSQVRDTWNRVADDWAREVRAGKDLYYEIFLAPAFTNFIGGLEGASVLDAGCGEGRTSRLMRKLGAGVRGVDISDVMIGHAREQEEREPLGIRYDVSSLDNMPAVESGTFDHAVSWMALQDVADYRGAVRELFRILKPGGRLQFCIMHPCFASPHALLANAGGQRGAVLAVNNYFRAGGKLLKWSFAGKEIDPDSAVFRIPRFGRTLSAYLDELLESGFVIDRIQEPRPSADICARYPRLAFWREHAALYLFIDVRKPDRAPPPN